VKFSAGGEGYDLEAPLERIPVFNPRGRGRRPRGSLPTEAMSAIRVENVHKTYANGSAAVRGVDLTAEDGEFLVLVGPSGCGKTTLLRMIAGLETVSSGRIVIGDKDVTHVPPQERDLAMVFQDYALYPHMTVVDNLAFGLRLSKMPRIEREQRVARVAATLGLQELLDRRPARCQAASGSVSPWDAPSSESRRHSSWTSRSRTSMRCCVCRCAPSSRACTSG